MLIIDFASSGSDKDDDDASQGPIRTLPFKQASDSTYNVETEIDALFAVNTACELAQKESRHVLSANDSAKPHANGALKWSAMTGNRDNIDNLLQDNHHDIFVRALDSYRGSVYGLCSIQEVNEQGKNSIETRARNGSMMLSLKSRYDADKATLALFEAAHRSLRHPSAKPYDSDIHFKNLADVWWTETGGPAYIDASILRSYPDWFIGKLIMHKCHQQEAHAVHRNMAINPLHFDVESETSKLYHSALVVQLLARQLCNGDTVRVFPAPSHSERDLDLRIVHWCQMTGGWKNVDDQIRKKYPQWFVNHLAQINKLLPAAKAMAYEQWKKAFVIKQKKGTN